ncbi:nitronate monooxygenase, partial [Lecanoromycetidae sp. Uapishka_2]
MAHTSTAPLASAVSNAGGLGVIGGLGYTPRQLRDMIHELKASLSHPSLPFGVDLALPAVGGTARKTNHDYTNGLLSELVDVIVEEKTTLFVSAVGVPPRGVIETLHAGGVVVMNMVGHPRHAEKAFEAGVDIVCAQGGEGGGHTGEISGNLLVPACVDIARRYRPKMLGGALGMVVAAGGIWDGRGLAGALGMGAVGVWVGTRFVASEEAGCSRAHKEAVVSAGWEDTTRTLVVSGRPLRVKRNQYIADWEGRQGEVKDLTERGVVPMEQDIEDDKDVDFPFLMGVVAAPISSIKPAQEIVEDMVRDAVDMVRVTEGYVDGGRRQTKL